MKLKRIKEFYIEHFDYILLATISIVTIPIRFTGYGVSNQANMVPQVIAQYISQF